MILELGFVEEGEGNLEEDFFSCDEMRKKKGKFAKEWDL